VLLPAARARCFSALAGAALPALDAARRPPARALKAGDEQAMFGSLVSAWPGLALLATGAAMTQLGPVGGLPVFGYAAIACVLLGGIALMPRLAQAVFDRLPPPRRVPAALALEQLRGAPGQAMVSLAAIVASFSLMVAMAIMVSSFRESVSDWLDRVLPHVDVEGREPAVVLDAEPEPVLEPLVAAGD